MTIRVLLADDQELIRTGFAALIGSAPDMDVVGEARDGAEAVAMTRQLHPDVVLMDIRMPGTDGLNATEQITTDPELSSVRVVVLTTFEAEDLVVAALRNGASGFLGKGVKLPDLLAGIRTVAAGEALLSPAATKTLISRVLSQPHAHLQARSDSSLSLLTERESQVVALVAEGLSNEEIARHLVVSPLTAKTHVSRSMVKLGVRDRAQLVVLAYQSGLVRPGGSAPPA
ncbi:response regulator transcription factor [Kineococcus glutinatus]|uniref:Response regulator transcription factor n=1 Tax=Kineococcus glutinatus TaxID=1070872 RepID=A0ABP9HGJ3_9ACTN